MKFLSAIIISLLIVVGVCKKAEQKTETISKPAHNDLPALQLITTDGQQLFTKNLTGKTVLVLFQPDCDHCQREAKQIQENLSAFAGYQLYFISAVTDQELIQFARNYKLEAAQIHFGNTTAEQIINSFGSIDTPSVFIYSAEGKLMNKFIGETDISKILPAL